MRPSHEYLSTLPFDVYELSLFQLVAASGSFTKAAREAGVTQSAITRQIQGIESQVGVALFERTTRRVALTDAGRFLLERSAAIVDGVGQTFRQLREEFAGAPKTLSVGVSRSIGLAYLPGFFVSFRQKHPAVRTHVVQQSSAEILSAIEANTLQVGILCPPDRLPPGVKITHRFRDEFVLIAPPDAVLPAIPRSTAALLQKLAQHDWILLGENSNTGRLLRRWLAKHEARIGAAMEVDTFDLIVNLVAMGMGFSIVPRRALPLYPRTRAIQRVPLRPGLSREVVVVVRKDRKPPEQLTQFIDCVLFGRV